MANDCYTEYVIRGEQHEVKALYDAIKELEKPVAPLIGNGWGKLWAGYLVEKLGGSYKDMCCRGEIASYELHESGTEMYVCTVSAWSELDEVREFIVGKFPSLKVLYTSEEGGCCYYETNDADCEVFGHYKLEVVGVEGASEEQSYFNTSEEVLAELGKIVGVRLESIEQALEYIEDFNEQDESGDRFINLCVFDVVGVEENEANNHLESEGDL